MRQAELRQFSHLNDRPGIPFPGRLFEITMHLAKLIRRIEYEKNGRTDHRDFALAGLGTNADFLGILQENSVRTIHTLKATLEDIFVQVTGRSLV
jgi:fluoroquinolone transport system ATP-binding protein